MATEAPEKQKAAAVPQVFRVGTYASEQNDYDQTVTMATSERNFPSEVVEPNGWLRGMWFIFDCVTAANAATVAFQADGPFSAISKITFKDVGNREVFGPLGGYEWLCIMKYGGYFELGDPRSDITYSATTGAGATGGAFTMVMYLPLEIVSRDALGDLENKSSSSTFKVEVVLAASTAVYSTPPTTLGTVRMRIALDGYTEPDGQDANGLQLSDAPPAAGTMQYWTLEDDARSPGNASYLIQNGLGYSLRNLIFKLVDSNGSRTQGDSDWPDPLTLTFGKIQLFQRYKTIWNSKIGKAYGLTNTTPNASLGRESGVYPVWFTDDFGLRPGNELRNGYLNTKPGNVLKWQGTIGGSGVHTLYTLVNYVIPPANNPALLRSIR